MSDPSTTVLAAALALASCGGSDPVVASTSGDEASSTAEAPTPDPDPDPAPPPEDPRDRERVTVDVERDFPGLIDAFFSDRKDLYPIEFEAFEALHGERTTRGELRDLQEEWTAARAVGEAAVAPDPADLAEAGPPPVEERVAGHAFFRAELGRFTRFDDLEHFVLFVQAPEWADAAAAQEHADAARRKYGALVDGMENLFRELYAEPRGLEQRASLRPYALFVLDGRAQYDAYMQAAQTDLRHARAHYDPVMHVEISYVEPGFEGESHNLHAMLHELVHGIEQADYQGRVGMPGATWFNEGFAEYLAFERMVRIQARSRQAAEREANEREACDRLGRQVGAHSSLAACVAKLETLNVIGGYGDAYTVFNELAMANGHPGAIDQRVSQEFLYAQSYAWMAYLHDGADGAWRDGLQEYVARLLEGEAPERALSAAFDAGELREVNAGFLDFLHARDNEALATLVERAWGDG